MPGIRTTGVRAALFTAPLVAVALLGTGVAPAGATGSASHHTGKSLTCRGRASTRMPSSATGPRPSSTRR